MKVDHLVMGVESLAQAEAWCVRELGVAPSGGGPHALMGTHNRLLNLGERCYLEFIAIDPDAPAPTGHRRWFGLDEPDTRARLRQGPALLHWVAAVDDIHAARSALVAEQGFDPGEPTAASRGDYRWLITVRPDGRPQHEGAVPTLIQWQSRHPADALPPSPWRLQALFSDERLGATLAGPRTVHLP
jgi:Glyoxalase-like domain